MSELAKLQAEFESAKPGYAFGKLPSGNYIYEGVNDMFKDYLENNELRKAQLRITELEAQLSDAKQVARYETHVAAQAIADFEAVKTQLAAACSAIQEAYSFQNSGCVPTIHDYRRWRRIEAASAAALAGGAT